MDTYFFAEAMQTANKHLDDMRAGDRLHKLLTTKDNYKFIGDYMEVSLKKLFNKFEFFHHN